MGAILDYPSDDEFEAWRQEALADEARTGDPKPAPVPNRRGALGLILEHHRPDAGETWHDALDGLRARDMADAVYDRHGFGLAERPPIDHDDLWHAAAFLLQVPEWAPDLWSALLHQRPRFLRAQARDLR